MLLVCVCVAPYCCSLMVYIMGVHHGCTSLVYIMGVHRGRVNIIIVANRNYFVILCFIHMFSILHHLPFPQAPNPAAASPTRDLTLAMSIECVVSQLLVKTGKDTNGYDAMKHITRGELSLLLVTRAGIHCQFWVGLIRQGCRLLRSTMTSTC